MSATVREKAGERLSSDLGLPGEEASGGKERQREPGPLSFLVLAFVLLLGFGAFLIGYSRLIGYDVNVSAAIPMIATIVLGLSGPLLILFAMASGFKRLGLIKEGGALGLPEGSIRAVLALSLLVTFVAFNFYLFRSLNYPLEAGPLPARTADQVAALDPGLILRVTPNGADPNLYDVYITRRLSGDAQLMVQQVTTTLGTLVVAVSAFYFGTTVAGSRRENASSPPAAKETATT